MRVALVVAVALVVPAGAFAKGASDARIVGPGFEQRLRGAALGDLAEYGGVYHAIFGGVQSPSVETRPAGELGPKYTVTWTLPGPNDVRSVVRQELYPYAKPNPVTFTPPGQPYWGGRHVRGGWFVGNEGLLWTLEDIGLPATPPSVDGSSGFDWWPALAGLAGGLAVLTVAAALVRRRRHPATAAPA